MASGEERQVVFRVCDEPEVYLLRAPFDNIAIDATNVYVVLSGDEALVIDAGAPSERAEAAMRAGMADLHLERRRVSWFLTHMHLDHAGLIDRLARRSETVYVSRADFEGASRNQASWFRETRDLLLSAGINEHDASGYARIVAEPPMFELSDHAMVPLDDGDHLRVGDVDFSVVATPGHTSGHQALFCESAGILFSGDHVLSVISPSIAAMPDDRHALSSYLDSLARVEALAPRLLAVSHGELGETRAGRLAWLREHHLARAEEAYGIVAGGRDLTADEVVRALHWNVPFDSWEEISFIQRSIIVVSGIAVLDYLVGLGRIGCEPDGHGIGRYRAL